RRSEDLAHPIGRDAHTDRQPRPPDARQTGLCLTRAMDGAPFDIEAVLGELTLEEKAGLTIGRGAWTVAGVPRVGVPGLTMADGPHGVRKQARLDDRRALGTLPATCFPTAS